MSLWDALRMNMMISYQELVRTFPKFMNKKGRKFILCGLHCLTPYFSKYV
uniref:Transcriptional regulator of catabolic arginine decarboxylase (AdiA) n=1 Tax=Escherichia coli TaxID=562 RepID=A0A7T8R128_ECOLX|nr:Transcriptional regulator of catabolic arginine decarboxylase (adiA) [Escherichia coli]